jgi:methylmalonyl-CoA mutase
MFCHREKKRAGIGGVIPDEDLKILEDEGVAAVFQPGERIADAAIRVLDELNKRLGHAQ